MKTRNAGVCVLSNNTQESQPTMEYAHVVVEYTQYGSHYCDS